MGAKSRRKGAVGERELAGEFSKLFGVEARRGCQYHGGEESPDIRHEIAGVHVECKLTESLSLYPAMQQAVRDAGENVPIVCHRRNGKPWLAVVRLDDLPRLAELIYLTMAENA